uniref:Uncharacterized protein n=1 Tax=Candidatus Kentrum eta TaxID=2126337 RepID=A0A450UN65_9GAMM|nr:MAG: hypothetical protein BECKH772A_GA0070896_1006410 [Candidatus Kentron sp. H]VFJ94726.1 MAG: hypothetical protein BECKH772B_GA0070898_1006610 [Candidatus Kentron sp. H]VFK01338.1 MAG: hypothetical protein BECKH772C_GA0070978_100639 [Candidatus Kentron sp. H]
MSTLESDILTAAREDRLLDYIDERWLSDRDDPTPFSEILIPLAEALVKLHNEGKIDVVAAFGKLKNDNQSPDFFLTRHIFGKMLPKIEAPMPDVMACVLHLYHEAGQDLAAGWILPPYVDFCGAQPARPKEAIGCIEASVDKLADLLTPSLVAGSRLDAEQYLNEAIRFSTHSDIAIRRRAVFSLGRIEYPEESHLPEKALMTLGNAIGEESDDELIGSTIKSAFSLYRKQEALEGRVTGLIDTVLTGGGDQALHAASEILFFEDKEIPEPLLDKLLLHLRRVNPAHKGTLDNIDHGLEKLLAGENTEKAIRFIEALLTTNAESLSVEAFDGVIRELVKNREGFLNRVMTRWFLGGERALCKAIHDVVDHQNISENNLRLAANSNELGTADPERIRFLARKAIGYLFFRPVTAASIVLSLMEYAEDDETKKALTGLLFDPLSINYGEVGDYLKEQVDSENDSIGNACKESLALLDQYMEGLKSTGGIPELYPSRSQQEDYHRHYSKQMSEAMRKAGKKSVWRKIAAKEVLLYGIRSINHMRGPDGKERRMEIPLQSYERNTEIPRLSIIAPFDLDYTLRVFRAEKIQA